MKKKPAARERRRMVKASERHHPTSAPQQSNIVGRTILAPIVRVAS